MRVLCGDEAIERGAHLVFGRCGDRPDQEGKGHQPGTSFQGAFDPTVRRSAHSGTPIAA